MDPAASKGFGAKVTAFRRLLWNPEKKQIVGRDGMNWAKIGLFYFVFFACLAGFFSAMLAVFMQIIDRRVPTYTLGDSILSYKGVNPGMGFRPQPYVERNLIKYNRNQTEGEDGWGLYHNALQRYLKDFILNDTMKESGYKDCSPGSKNHSAGHDEDSEDHDGKSCFFDIHSLGGDDMPCSEANYYSYPSGQPCVVIKLNRIFNWVPKAYASNDSVPKEISSHWREDKKNYIYVTCSGENAADEDNLKEIDYYSPLNNEHVGGFPFYYFPFMNQPGYHQPLVFVHFKNVTKHTLINVECRAWAANVGHERLTQRGSVHFELLID